MYKIWELTEEIFKGMGSLALFSIVPEAKYWWAQPYCSKRSIDKGIIGVGGIGRSNYHFVSGEQCRLVSV